MISVRKLSSLSCFLAPDLVAGVTQLKVVEEISYLNHGLIDLLLNVVI
jgi:hypothetical protein